MFNYRSYMGVWYSSLFQLVMMFVFIHLCSVLLFGVKLSSFSGMIAALLVSNSMYWLTRVFSKTFRQV